MVDNRKFSHPSRFDRTLACVTETDILMDTGSLTAYTLYRDLCATSYCVTVTCGGNGGTRWRRRSELVDARFYEKCEAIIFIDKSTCISYCRKPHML